MSIPSVMILPPNLEATIDRVGEKVRASGQYGHTSGLHTIAIKLLNFRGRVFIEGSLATDPSDNDWFQIPPDADLPYFEFPSEIYPITNPLSSISGYSGTVGFSFHCNCLWLRARVIRSHILPSHTLQDQISLYGSVDTIIGSYTLGGMGSNFS